jgi:putative ABC transport system ATP-binding protein
MTLSLKDIEFSYAESDFELRVSRLQIEPGSSAALVGPSGSGKTTLLNLIAGIAQPSQGSIALSEHVLSVLSAHQWRSFRLSSIGMIFQSFELLDYLNVQDNVLLQARLAPGVTIDDALQDRARAIASDLGLGDKWQRPVTALSQGERQRVAVCRALLLDPPLVLADEPTGNLDPQNKQAVLDELIALCRRDQRILLTVTHDHSLLPSFDHVVDMTQLLGGGA